MQTSDTLDWQRRHQSDTGWLGYDGKFIRGQVVMYDDTGDDHLRTGRHYFKGYLTNEAKAVTGRCESSDEAKAIVEQAFSSPAGRAAAAVVARRGR